MKRKNRLQILLYASAGWAASFCVWLLFVVLRRVLFQHDPKPLEGQQFVNAGVVATAWVLLYAISGLYLNPFKRSRFHEIGQIARTTTFGVLVLFFAIVLDDGFADNRAYRSSFLAFLALQVFAVSLAHVIITTRTSIRIRRRQFSFPTLVVGCGKQAAGIVNELNGLRHALGYGFRGYVSVGDEAENHFQGKLKRFGTIEDIERIITSRQIQDVIIALEPSQQAHINTVLEVCGTMNISIKAVPGTYDFLVGTAKIGHILGTPLVELRTDMMQPWQWVAKRGFDIGFSALALLLLSPLYALLTVLVRLNSAGQAFYSQERIGKSGKPFRIFKFRSMYMDAEKTGPALSSDKDPRITSVGLILRKTRLDELPQFWNVLIGDMSVVGPRPERKFFIDQLVKVAPHYRQLHKVRPGITSWGQVKYGYASTIEEMVERLNFDILYLENISLSLDIKIILYTVIVMVEGRGK